MIRTLAHDARRSGPVLVVSALLLDSVFMVFDYAAAEPTRWTESVGGFLLSFMALFGLYLTVWTALESRSRRIDGGDPRG